LSLAFGTQPIVENKVERGGLERMGEIWDKKEGWNIKTNI